MYCNCYFLADFQYQVSKGRQVHYGSQCCFFQDSDYIRSGPGLAGHQDSFKSDSDKIILKKNSLLPVKEMASSEIKKIEIFPLNLIFYFHKGGKTVLRFGTTYTDNIEPDQK